MIKKDPRTEKLARRSRSLALVLLPPANEVWGNIMFLQASVILLTGEGSASVHAGIPPPLGADTPPASRSRHLPWEQTPPPGSRHPQEQTLPEADTPPCPPEQTPPGADTPGSRHPPPQSMLGDTVNARAVRILLECNLVYRFALTCPEIAFLLLGVLGLLFAE